MNHEESVEHWLGASFATLPVERQLKAIERGFTALWLRARGTLGDVTLGAIGERVLAHAQDRFPFLSAATLDRDGLRCTEVRAPSSAILGEAARHLLVELLTIVGRLTAEILTPALHDELEGTLHPANNHVRPRAAPVASDVPTAAKQQSKTSKTMSKAAKATKRTRQLKNKTRSSPQEESS